MNDRVLSLSFGWLLVPLGVALALLGAWNSPTNEQGRPLLLLPEVKAVADYRSAANSSVAEIGLLDGEITALVEGQNADLFAQSGQAQAAFEHAVRIFQDIDTHTAPPALNGLKDALTQAASDYVEVARLALRWVSLPTAENKVSVEDQLTRAEQELQTLAGSQWLAKTSP